VTGETVSAGRVGPLPGPAEAWVPRPYTQLLRGPAHRWWRPLLGLGVVLLGIGVVLAWTAVVLGAAVAVGLLPVEAVRAPVDQWWVLLLSNLGLAAMVPLSMAAVWAAHGWRPRWVSSVAGRLRWRWMLLVAVVSAVVTVAGSVALWALVGWPWGSGRDVVVLLLVVATTTPLQAAGEEYLFRGWLSQAVGSLARNAVVGAVAAAVVSAVLFALAHGGQDVWLFLDRLAFGLLASYLVWRTGGLEAAIAVHTVNNVVVFVPTILTGGLADALLVTDAPPGLVAADVVGMVVLAVVVSVLARRRRVRRLFVPPAVLVPSRPLG
jgi:membrane protease YdiL (CAAX protease family)